MTTKNNEAPHYVNVLASSYPLC